MDLAVELDRALKVGGDFGWRSGVGRGGRGSIVAGAGGNERAGQYKACVLHGSTLGWETGFEMTPPEWQMAFGLPQ
jgi:hypothetical protein